MDPKRSPYTGIDWEEPEWLKVTVESEQYVDFMFVVDGSSTVGGENFATIMKWIGSFAQDFDLSTGRIQIGLVQYSHWYRARKSNNQRDMRTEIPLGLCANITCLEERLNSVQLIGHTTFTGYAINKTVNEDFRSSRNFKSSFKIMVVVTDSISRDRVLEAANYARKMDIHIYAIGITPGANINELREIATGKPLENNGIYILLNYPELQYITESLRSEIRSFYMRYVCPPLPPPIHGELNCTNHNVLGSKCTLNCNLKNFNVIGEEINTCNVYWPHFRWEHTPSICGMCKEKFDLLIVLDSSSSVSCPRFILAKKFISLMIDAMIIGPDDVQVATIRYYSNVDYEFSYSEYLDRRNLKEAFRKMEYCGTGTRTLEALKYATENLFNEESGRRADVPHITLLITDGPTKDNINDPSPQLRMMSKVFTIGLGNAQLDEMRDIASKPIPAEIDRIFSDYHNLINATLVRTLLKHFCDAVTDIKSTFCNIAELDANATCERYEYSGELKPAGTSCQLPCAKGYENPNSSKAICTYEGTWHRDNWSCVEKACERPGNSNVVPVCDNGFKIDSSCQLKCRPGFELILPPDPTGCKRDQNGPLHCTRKCLRVENDDPMWDLDAIECKRTDVCTPTSCMNDGKCEKGVDEVTCNCTPGYTGILCENVIDECENINCNNGTCRNEIGSYVCECDEGYDGTHCENDIDDCANNRCGYYGTLRCVDQVNGYSCSCKRGFAGKYCDIFINECNSNPCKNGGTCNDGIGFFTCTCSSGYEGEFCQFEINECLKNLCNKTTTKDCIDGVSKYECVCFDGWSGTSCHKDIDECSQSPCVNDGKCINTLGSFECTCAAGYRGSLCAERIDLCRSHPCVNGANCTSSVNSYACDCTPGYTGKTCSRNIDECHGVDCNNGRCEDGENEYSCICKDGFSGRHCAIEINECDPDPCVNGDCEDGVASYRCLCHPGHTGKNCEIDIDYCKNVVCLNGGKCKELVTDFECECKTGFEGPLCGRDVDECTFPENDCSGRGVCNNTNGGYSCECNAGYDGENCERNIDECKNHECKNKAECIDEINNYTCSCHEGYTGRYCETDIDDCSSNPCRNNATCRDELNRYECKCKPGFVGKHCQVVNKVCLSKPCKNKAKCNPLVDGGYRCDCERGYKGYNCEKDIDECKVRPPICRNGGTCKNRIGGWNCTCPQGYQGEMCETRLCKYPRQRTLEGDMTCSDGMMPGSKCVITCPKGFGMAQNSKRKFKASTRQEITCMKNFRWNYSNLYLQGNPPEWSCDPVTCREIEKAGADSELSFQMVDENVEVQQDAHRIHCTHGVEYNSTCSLKCHRNYTSIRGSDRRCTEVGTWSGQRWSCTPKKCNDSEIPEVENGGYKCTNGTRLGSVCSAVCNKGFKRYEKSDDRIFCKELNGVMTWSGLKPRVGYNSNSASKDHCWRCVSEKEISTHCNPCKMPFIKNGKYSCNDGERQGSNCTVVCDPGFVEDSRNSELICDSVDGSMVWRTKRLSGNRCFESECDASVDLSALEMIGSDYLATVTPFYMDDSSQELCGGQSVLSINVTRAVTIVMQLWYGRRLAGHHTTISTIGPAQTTSTGYTFAGVGDHFTVSGFENASAPNGKPSVSGTLPISAIPNSRVTITLSYDLWKLESREGSWEGKVSLRANSQTVIGSNSRWYTVYIGLNTDISGNRLENGRGLCKVCFIRN